MLGAGESSAFPIEMHEYRWYRAAVAIFCDDDLCAAGCVVWVVVFAALDEDDYVAILFDLAAVSEIAHHGAMVSSLFDFSRELRDADDRSFDLHGEHFEFSRDFGDLILAALCSAADGQELQVVDDDEADILFFF